MLLGREYVVLFIRERWKKGYDNRRKDKNAPQREQNDP